MQINKNREKKKYSLLFLTVNSSFSHSSLALPLLHNAAGSLDKMWNFSAMEKVVGEEPVEIAASVVKESPDLLCTTLYLFNHAFVMDILQRVHTLAPHIHIAAGGPQCTEENALSLLEKYPFLSTVFVGEGEEFFPGFLRDFPEKREEKRVLPPAGRGIYKNWASSPYPCESPFFRFDKPFIQLETSRGCPMNCSYCTSCSVPPRYREISQVREELSLLQKKGVKEIRILDRTFNLPEKRGRELLELFAAFAPMRFHLEFHPEFTGKELQETLKKMPPGLLHIEAGIQSFDQKVQTASGRKSDPQKVKENLAFLVSLRDLFEVHTDLIAGLPEQTKQSLLDDILLLMQIAPAEIQLETLKVLPGTKLEKEKEKYGIIHSSLPPYDVMQTSSMSTGDILEMRMYSRLLDLFYNHKVLHKVMVAAAKKDSRILVKIAEKTVREKKNFNTLLDLKKRFFFLAPLLKESGSEEAGFLLACAWLEAGFPLSTLPAKKLQIVEKLPEGLLYLQGDESCKEKRETKYYLLSGEKEKRFFAFNRAFSMNLPCCIWQQK